MPAKKSTSKSAKSNKPAAPTKPAAGAKAPSKSKTADRSVGAKETAANAVATSTVVKKTPVAAASDNASKGPQTKEVVATYVQRNPRPIAPPPDAEDGDDSNLLAGPRNVQPYIVKRGEQYMSREQLEHFRTILETWKRDLMQEVDRTVSHMKDEAANFPDPNDRATQEEEFSLELRTRDRERKLIRKIEEALQRIEDGSYGYCLETGEEIGVKRLEARPVATLSLEAQERRERREKQYGDRDDRYR